MQCLTIILYGRKFWRIAENMSFGRIYFWRLSPSYNDIHSKMANHLDECMWRKWFGQTRLGAFNNIIHGIARQYPVAEAFRQAFGRLCNVHSLMQGHGPTCYSYKRNMPYNLQHTEHDEHIHCVSVSWAGTLHFLCDEYKDHCDRII